jgi:hypothetical protein
MGSETSFISLACRRRLHIQGYEKFSDKELSDFKFGIRFAYAGCITLVAVGLFFQSIPVLMVTVAIAFAAIFLPYHPFDYLYNYGVRHVVNKPKTPQRTNQSKFACGIASIWLSITIYLLYANHALAANIMAIVLFMIGALVSTTDICIPSMIYNGLLKKAKT